MFFVLHLLPQAHLLKSLSRPCWGGSTSKCCLGNALNCALCILWHFALNCFLFTDGHIDICLQIRNLPLISPCHSNVLCCPYLFVKWSLSVIGSALSALCLEGMQKMKMFTLLQFLPLLSGAESAACKLSTAFLSKSRFTALSELLKIWTLFCTLLI